MRFEFTVNDDYGHGDALAAPPNRFAGNAGRESSNGTDSYGGGTSFNRSIDG